MWTSACQDAFEALKDRLTSPPVLAYPVLAFVLHTDASGVGLWAVLEQEQEDGKLHPVSHASRTLSKHESKYGITDLEALGVVWACKHFRAYLLGHHCVVYTDHAPLKAMLRAKHQSGKPARCAGIISELDLDIQYRPGRKHSNADALSRSQVDPDGEANTDVEGVVAQVMAGVDTSSLGVGAEELVKLQVEDEHLQAIREYLLDGILPEDEKRAKRMVLERERLVILEGVLYYVDSGSQHRLRIAVPMKIQEALLKETHAGPFGGHFAASGLYNTLSRLYWWDGMFGEVV